MEGFRKLDSGLKIAVTRSLSKSVAFYDEERERERTERLDSLSLSLSSVLRPSCPSSDHCLRPTVT